MSNDPSKNHVKTTHTVFDVLEFLKEAEGTDLSTVASELGIAKSTAHRHLSTLLNRGYVIREGAEYDLSLRFLELGTYASNRKPGYKLTKQLIDQLADETGEHAQFFVEEHGKCIYLYGQAGEHAVQSGPQLGEELFMHATAGGKAILAYLPDLRVNEIIDHHGLPEITQNTITDKSRLQDELETIREQNYSVNKEEDYENLRAIGVPIQGKNDTVFGAVSISGPRRRMKGERFESELPSYLLGRTNELELNLQFSESSTESEAP